MITQTQCHELFEYRDGRLFWKISKGTAKAGSPSHSNGNGYKAIKIDGKPYLEHRLVWLWHYGEMPEALDHINGDAADNRIENLRLATYSENNRNARIRSDNKSGVKGVSWCKSKSSWKVQLWYDGKQNFLGRFKSLEDAKLAAMSARTLHHGAFVNHG